MNIQLGADPVKDYNARVLADGGSIVEGRTNTVYRDTRSLQEPTLVCACDAGKSAVLYALAPDPVAVSANAEASASNIADVTFSFDGFPRIVATRDSAGTTINVTAIGSSAYSNFRVYRAGDHRSIFSVESNSTALPYTDSGLDASLNYKYKATYVATGTKGGSPYVKESQSSRPVYTVGNKRI